MLEGEPDRLPGGQGEPSGSGCAVNRQVDRGRQQQPVGAPAGGHPARDGLQQRVDQPVLGSGGVVDLHLHLPIGAAKLAQQHPGGTGAQVVAAVVAADRHGVDQHRDPGRGPKGGLQRHGLVDVGAAGLNVAGWPDHEVTGGLVQQPREDGGPVEAGEAQPVHRTGPADQGG
jgi:hypothetical protein